MKPVAILLNGLLMYQPGGLTPLAPLASQLEAAGWEVCIDNHFNTRCHHPKPDLIIGHSQGGATALRLAAERKPALVITFDAVRMQACPSGVRCINFRTPAYPSVPNGENIPVIAEHTTMVYLPNLKERVLSYAANATRTRAEDKPPPRMAVSRNSPPQAQRSDSGRHATPSVSVRHSDEEARNREHPPRPDGNSPIDFRWPDTNFGELSLPLELQCEMLSFPNPEVCP